jgi:hypothetical protein
VNLAIRRRNPIHLKQTYVVRDDYERLARRASEVAAARLDGDTSSGADSPLGGG